MSARKSSTMETDSKQYGMLHFHIEDDEKQGKVIVLDRDFSFFFQNKIYTIPEGFQSDGMSIPRFFWRFISPQLDFQTLIPSIQHDFAYMYHIGERRDIDKWYRNLLVAYGMPKWKADIVYMGVRLGGSSHW